MNQIAFVATLTHMEKKKGRWTVKDTHKRFENEFFTVYEDDVIQPDGKPGTYATIKFPAGVAVLPVDDDGNVYLTKQFRYALGRYSIEAVSGAMDGDEPLDAAKRETGEETGIRASEWEELGKIETDTSITNSTSHLFLCRGLEFGKPHREGTEDIELVKMHIEDAVRKVLNGEITNGQTVALLLKACERHYRK